MIIEPKILSRMGWHEFKICECLEYNCFSDKVILEFFISFLTSVGRCFKIYLCIKIYLRTRPPSFVTRKCFFADQVPLLVVNGNPRVLASFFSFELTSHYFLELASHV